MKLSWPDQRLSSAVAVALLWACWYQWSNKPMVDTLVAEKRELSGQVGQLQNELLVAQNARAQCMHTLEARSEQPAASQDPAVATLNAIRPGLGTLAAAGAQAIQKWQQQQALKNVTCPAGFRLHAAAAGEANAVQIGNGWWNCVGEQQEAQPE